MNTQAIQLVNTQAKSTLSSSSESIKIKRESYVSDNSSDDATSSGKNAIQPEELLQNIKSLTEDGLYSVRFEMHKDTKDLIINLVDSQSGEVLRQIPPKEIVSLHEYMTDLRGNIVSVES